MTDELMLRKVQEVTPIPKKTIDHQVLKNTILKRQRRFPLLCGCFFPVRGPHEHSQGWISPFKTKSKKKTNMLSKRTGSLPEACISASSLYKELLRGLFFPNSSSPRSNALRTALCWSTFHIVRATRTNVGLIDSPLETRKFAWKAACTSLWFVLLLWFFIDWARSPI